MGSITKIECWVILDSLREIIERGDGLSLGKNKDGSLYAFVCPEDEETDEAEFTAPTLVEVLVAANEFSRDAHAKGK